MIWLILLSLVVLSSGCPAGTYQNADDCTDCPTGTYQNEENQTGCKSCFVGDYQDLTGQTSINACKDCPSGRFSTISGSSIDDCTLCPLGFFNKFAGNNECYGCGGSHGNEYGDEIGLTACKDCPIGFFQDGWASEAADCNPCEAGKYQDESNLKECKTCTVGLFQSLVGQTQCVECPKGRYSLGGALCDGCSSGKYGDEMGQSDESSCKSCTAGLFQSLEGQSKCVESPLGAYSLQGSVMYLMCPNGSYGDETNMTACKDCPAGFESIMPVNCTACSSGKYQIDTNGPSCMSCPAGYNSSEAASSCDEIDECAVSPCVNGNCTDMVNDYRCTCEPGYKGVNCDINIDDCASSPCVNGNCTDLLNGYNCTCEPGYGDVNCDTDTDDCADVICPDSGTCVDKLNGYDCKPYDVTSDSNFYVWVTLCGVGVIVLFCVGLSSTHKNVVEYKKVPTQPKQLYW